MLRLSKRIHLGLKLVSLETPTMRASSDYPLIRKAATRRAPPSEHLESEFPNDPGWSAHD